MEIFKSDKMKTFYPKMLITSVKAFKAKKYILVSFIFLGLFEFLPSESFAQKLEFSYSYFNLTRNNGGGTLEQGDTIEIHALAKVNTTTNNFYYIDTMRTWTAYVPGSMQLITNEGIIFGGPYSDATNDDDYIRYI